MPSATYPLMTTVGMLYDRVHQAKGRIVISGMGKAGQTGQTIATTFFVDWKSGGIVHPPEAQHGDLGIWQEDDLLMILSNSRKTTEIHLLIELARGLHPTLPIICITGHPDNQLGQLANLALGIGEPIEICTLDLMPTTSTTVMTVLGDILVVLFLERIAITGQDYAQRHHSEYLGEKSRNHG